MPRKEKWTKDQVGEAGLFARREYGPHPDPLQARTFGGNWVVRTAANEFVDWDQYRNDLAERYPGLQIRDRDHYLDKRERISQGGDFRGFTARVAEADLLWGPIGHVAAGDIIVEDAEGDFVDSLPDEFRLAALYPGVVLAPAAGETPDPFGT